MTIHLHEYRAWKAKLRSTKSENQVELYQCLSILKNELDPLKLQERMKNFIDLWSPIEADFILYFKQYYESQAGIIKKNHNFEWEVTLFVLVVVFYSCSFCCFLFL